MPVFTRSRTRSSTTLQNFHYNVDNSTDEERRYKFTPIEEVKKVKIKTGNKTRTIYIPKEDNKKKELNGILRILYKSKFGKLVSPWACAYVRGRDIIDAAKPHVGYKYVAKIDLQDFFGSVTFEKFAREIMSKKYKFMTDQDIATILVYVQPCFVKDKRGRVFLPQGFATSPIISNLFMGNFDWKVAKFAKKKGVNYTRYADDIALSSNNKDKLQKVIAYITILLRDMELSINKKKFRIMPYYRRQIVCGIVVNNKINLPRETRKLIRAMRHRHKNDEVVPPEISGMYSYEHMVQNKANLTERIGRSI